MRNELATNSEKLDRLHHGAFGLQHLYNEVANISRRNLETAKVAEVLKPITENVEFFKLLPRDIESLKSEVETLKKNSQSHLIPVDSELNTEEAKVLKESMEKLGMRLSWLENVIDRKK